jgi:hypothetical protein
MPCISSPAVSKFRHLKGRGTEVELGGMLKRADELVQAQQAEGAKKLLVEFLSDRDHPGVWHKLARVCQLLGEDIVAMSLLRNIVPKLKNPHIVDIIAARIPYGKPIVLPSCKLLYYNIPKCGSSSIKDAILIAAGRTPKKETSHFHVAEFEVFMSFQEIDLKYAGYTSMVVIRPPSDRLRSYWRKNVHEAASLVKEAHGASTFYGLNTHPSYVEILGKFQRYRQVFVDFRHHTDSIIGYIGQSPERIKHIFDVSEVDGALNVIRDISGASIPTLHNMQSVVSLDVESREKELETQLISSFYDRETKMLKF